MALPVPPPHYRILEVNIISAEDLAPVSKNMKTYAMAWINPDEKLSTGVDETGGTDPIWNDKFNFRVDDKFLSNEDAAIVVEIYAAAWVKDAVIGQVNVLINDIFHMRSIADARTKNTATRTVALQVRRPSGRPQGILNVEISLADDEDPFPIAAHGMIQEFGDDDENKSDLPEYHHSNPNAKISRSRSNGTDLTMEDNLEKKPAGMGSIVNCDSGASEIKCNGSMVNGDSLCNSDVGPSASVVAAAIAKGLYIPPPVQNRASSGENKKIKEWTRKEMRGESLDMKLERWKTEISQPVTTSKLIQQVNSTKGKKSKGNKKDDSKLFSCFGNAFGLEISISCGGGNKKKHANGNGNNKICHLSSVDDNYSQSIF